MFSKKITYFFAICFILYSLLHQNYRVTGTIMPKIAIPEIAKLPNDAADDSFMLKALKKVSYQPNGNFACDVLKQEMVLYRVFISDSSANNLTCEDSFQMSYKIYQPDGKLLFQSHEAKKYTLAHYNIPYALQKALIYAKHQSDITIITSAKYLINNAKMHPLTEFFPADVVNSLSEIILIDLQIH
jgi:hypothetical protein